MTKQEANKIIAEYMGREIVKKGYYYFLVGQVDHTDLDSLYTESIDALVPVWEKLNQHEVFLNTITNRNGPRVSLYSQKSNERYSPFDPFDFYEGSCNSLQKSAAIATAKAILALNK